MSHICLLIVNQGHIEGHMYQTIKMLLMDHTHVLKLGAKADNRFIVLCRKKTVSRVLTGRGNTINQTSCSSDKDYDEDHNKGYKQTRYMIVSSLNIDVMMQTSF